MPELSVIVINYNGKGMTVSCLEALNRQSLSDFEIVIIDNGSSDGSLNEIIEFSKRDKAPRMKIVADERNLGFACGNDVGLKHSTGDYIALLNNDAIPDPVWLEKLVRSMDKNEEVGICASKMLSLDEGVIDSAGDGFSTALKGFKRGEGDPANLYDKKEFIFGACAGAALYRRKMIEEIGFFDEDFFLIQEDTDLNFRAQFAGWKVLYVPEAIVHHKVRSTIGEMSDTAVYYTLRNTEFVRIKNIPFVLFLKSLPEFIISIILEFLFFAVKHKKARLYVRAKLDVLRMAKSMLRKRSRIRKMKKVTNSYLRDLMTSVWNKDFLSTKIKKFIRK